MAKQLCSLLPLQRSSPSASGELQVGPVMFGRSGPLRLKSELRSDAPNNMSDVQISPATSLAEQQRVYFIAERQLSAPLDLSEFEALRFRTPRRYRCAHVHPTRNVKKWGIGCTPQADAYSYSFGGSTLYVWVGFTLGKFCASVA